MQSHNRDSDLWGWGSRQISIKLEKNAQGRALGGGLHG